MAHKFIPRASKIRIDLFGMTLHAYRHSLEISIEQVMLETRFSAGIINRIESGFRVVKPSEAMALIKAMGGDMESFLALRERLRKAGMVEQIESGDHAYNDLLHDAVQIAIKFRTEVLNANQ